MGDTTTTTTTTTNNDVSISGNMEVEVDGGGVAVEGEVKLDGMGALIDGARALGDVVIGIIDAVNRSGSTQSESAMQTEEMIASVEDNELVFEFKRPQMKIEMEVKRKLKVLFRKKKFVLLPGKYKTQKSQLRLSFA
ncbi:MAG: hypothetical protein AAF218_00225 [Pseudomonadota bacterium]